MARSPCPPCRWSSESAGTPKGRDGSTWPLPPPPTLPGGTMLWMSPQSSGRAPAQAGCPSHRPPERPFHPRVDTTTGHIKGRLWKVMFFPKPEKFRVGAQTFSSLFRNNKSSGSWYQIKAQTLNSPEEEAAWDQICVCLLFFIQLLKKGLEICLAVWKSGGGLGAARRQPAPGAPGRGGGKYLVDMTMETAPCSPARLQEILSHLPAPPIRTWAQVSRPQGCQVAHGTQTHECAHRGPPARHTHRCTHALTHRCTLTPAHSREVYQEAQLCSLTWVPRRTSQEAREGGRLTG